MGAGQQQYIDHVTLTIIHYKEERDAIFNEDISYYNYYVYQKNPNQTVPKIIFLWTPLLGKYKDWSWGIGPEPIVEDCNDTNVDGRCLITTHPGLLEEANVVLFSILDIKRVSSSGI